MTLFSFLCRLWSILDLFANLCRRPPLTLPSEGLGVVSEELKAVLRCRFFVALMYF
ncbi:MAG: hypothetical protein LBC74_03980 [Planctomycetaceae bacterium]|nr:hypothetical protein [Planctomycetaceae bacterium]